MSYYRIHNSKPAADFTGNHHASQLWIGESDIRHGLSCCADYADLLAYFTDDPYFSGSICRGVNLDDCYLVIFEGELSDDEDHEAGGAGSPLLVHPTAIVSAVSVEQTTLTDDLCDAHHLRIRHHAGQWERWNDCDDCQYYDEGDVCEECEGGGGEWTD